MVDEDIFDLKKAIKDLNDDIEKLNNSDNLVPWALYRGKKSTLEEKDIIYPDQCLIVEMEEDDPYGLTGKELIKLKLRRKYKVADGIHKYSELPYGEGTIPVAFYQYKSTYLHILDSINQIKSKINEMI